MKCIKMNFVRRHFAEIKSFYKLYTLFDISPAFVPFSLVTSLVGNQIAAYSLRLYVGNPLKAGKLFPAF